MFEIPVYIKCKSRSNKKIPVFAGVVDTRPVLRARRLRLVREALSDVIEAGAELMLPRRLEVAIAEPKRPYQWTLRKERIRLGQWCARSWKDQSRRRTQRRCGDKSRGSALAF